jgi:signal transduction histidine kinase
MKSESGAGGGRPTPTRASGTVVLDRVGEIRLRLIEALPSLGSADDAMRACIEAVSDPTGASVGVWYVDEEPDSVEVRLWPAPGTVTLRVAEEDPRESEGLVRDAWRKGALVWSTAGSSDETRRFAIPLIHEARNSAVLECAFEGGSAEARLAADIVQDAAPSLGSFVATVRDISGRKSAQKELNDALSLERSASGRLRAVDQMRRTMLHAFAHEIVDPLSVVRGLSVWLSDHAEDRGRSAREDRQLAVSHLTMAADRMSRLLDGLLDLERLDLGAVVPLRRQTDVARIVVEVVEEMTGRLTERPVLDLERVVIAADPVHVDTIVRNLLRNAVAHSRAERAGRRSRHRALARFPVVVDARWPRLGGPGGRGRSGLPCVAAGSDGDRQLGSPRLAVAASRVCASGERSRERGGARHLRRDLRR